MTREPGCWAFCCGWLRMLGTPPPDTLSWVLFVTDSGRWAKESSRKSVLPARRSLLGPRAREPGGRAGPAPRGLPSDPRGCFLLCCPVMLLCRISCGIYGPAVSLAAVTARSRWLCPPGPGLEKRPSLAWYLAQNGCLMNIY